MLRIPELRASELLRCALPCPRLWSFTVSFAVDLKILLSANRLQAFAQLLFIECASMGFRFTIGIELDLILLAKNIVADKVG